MKPTRREIKQALKVAQSPETTFTRNKTLESLAARGLGFVNGKAYSISRQQKQDLKGWLSHQSIDWTTPWSAFEGDRLETAEVATDEKLSASTDNRERVLVSAIGPTVRVNSTTLPELEGSHVSLVTEFVRTIECDHLLVVENLPAFNSLYRLLLDFQGQSVLAVYRGDPTRPMGQTWAKHMSEEMDIPLAAYMDYDPAGLVIAIGSGAQTIILPRVSDLENVNGSQTDFTNQHIQWEQLRRMGMPGQLSFHCDYLGARKRGFTQERMLALGIVHQWFPIFPGTAHGK
ncbi:DUF7281 domain-containing protein [Marinobacter salsuginis]|jgi:hypothetical protein|uniref:DUF7281 domain-containing protein n=1 Tax=Marinobacter salsuginis TaxID=418719 RepID=A0A5M3PTG1_9GAMM|nr:hypothetical protein [Marinobacter salsuginis]GBO86232.1 hypothetical protein MS5N3_36830 [Marinobacter salsuginis]